MLVGTTCGPHAKARTVKVLSYNAYLFHYDAISDNTKEDRLKVLPEALAATNADIVLLQEVWSEQDRATLAERMAARGYQGAGRQTRSPWPPYFFGNGLYVFVKPPLRIIGETNVWTMPTPMQIRLDKLTRKGILRATIDVPEFGPVDVFSAHIGFQPFRAETHDFDPAYAKPMADQIRFLLSGLASSSTRLRILGADINTPPHRWDPARRAFDTTVESEAYRLLTREGGLVDAMAAVKEKPCADGCPTCDITRNEMIQAGPFQGVPGEDVWPVSRIDYVMVGGNGARVVDARLALEERYPLQVRGWFKNETRMLPLSDHYGVLTTLDLGPDCKDCR